MKLLPCAFAAFKQVSAIELNSNARAVSHGLDRSFLSGVPIFASIADESTIAGFSYPMLLISENGWHVGESWTDGQLRRIRSFSNKLFRRVVAGILKSQGEGYEITPGSEATLTSLILEGKRVIDAYGQFPSFTVASEPLPLFKSLLSRIKFEDLGKFFTFDMESQKIAMSFRSMGDVGVPRRVLLDELKARCPSADYLGDRHISIESQWMLAVLSEHYGKPVSFMHSREKAEAAEPGEDQEPGQRIEIS